MREMPILKRIMIAASSQGARLLRNNVGALQDRFGTWIRFGVGGDGGSDLIGWKTVTITNEMVGKEVAIFVACEVKSAKGKLTAEQRQFLEAVRKAGGIAFHARSVEDAMGGLNGF